MKQIARTDTRKYASVLRPLLASERAELRAQLQKDGLLHALVRDQHGDLLDGHSREDLCRELGIEPRYQTIVTDDPIRWIRGHQMARRNLNRDEVQKLIAEQVMANPASPNLTIAKRLGVSDHTVASVRSRLQDEGKVSNVVRMEEGGRIARGPKSNSQLANKTAPKPKYYGVVHQDAPQSLPEPLSLEAKIALYGEQPALELRKGKIRNLTEAVLWSFADDNEFHSIPQMIRQLDPEDRFKLGPMHFQRAAYAMTNERKDIYLETRPGVGTQKQYRFYRQGRTIGLAVLKAKFRPVIEALKAEARRPISHQSSGRFLDAAGMLIQLLRDLEAE